MRNTRFSIAAREEMDSYAAYIGKDSPEAASRFLRAARLTAADLAAFPYIGREMILWRLRVPGIGRLRIIGFPKHFVVHRVTPGTIDVLSVSHGPRNLPKVMRALWAHPAREKF